MTFTELLPALNELSETDKIKAIYFLEQELEKGKLNVSTLTTHAVLPLSASPPTTVPSVLGDTDVADKALEFYKTELQAILEPAYNGQHVAIDVDSRSYEVALRPGQASRALRAKRPAATIVVHTIGPAPSGLVGRMRGTHPI